MPGSISMPSAGGILSLVLGFFLDCLTSAIFGLYMFLYILIFYLSMIVAGKVYAGKPALIASFTGLCTLLEGLVIVLLYRFVFGADILVCDPEDLHPAGRRGGHPEPPLFQPFPPFRGFSACRRSTTGSTGMSRVSSKANSRCCSSSSRSRLSLIVMRLWYLQVIKGDELRQRSENNSVRLRKIKPMRGLIMDADRRVLVDNQPSFDIVFIPNRTKEIQKVIEKIKDPLRRAIPDASPLSAPSRAR